MKALVYQYENPDKQKSAFRGYVKQYRGPEALITTCKIVRATYAAAERDAKKLMKEIQKNESSIE